MSSSHIRPEAPVSDPAQTHVFSGGGEMGGLMRALDWSKTPVGDIGSWSQSLKTAVRIILTSRYPMFVWWGQDLINLYNDPYRAFLGIKHPDALGKSAREVWAEIWDQIGPRAEAVLLRGESTFDEGLLLLMERHGYLEETYFTFSYSPLPDDAGKIAGLFCAVTEQTQQIIGERRLALLRDIAAAMAECRTVNQVCEAAAQSLSAAQRDLPFSLIYLLDSDGTVLRRVCASGIPADHPAAPELIHMNEGIESVWPVRQVLDTGEILPVQDLSAKMEHLPRGAWNKPPESAVLLPIVRQGQSRPAGIFVAGLNPYRKFDDEFRGFLSLLSNQIAGSLANAAAYETERRRAESLAELDRAKTLFFSNVSHEFRTPLTLMLGPLEEVLPEARERLHPEHHEQLVAAHRNTLRLLKLVNTLLDFSRIEAGRVQAVFEPTDIAGYTAEIASAFRSAMDSAGLRFSIDCRPVAEPVYIDRGMWEKVVLNLLSNAFKFTFHGEISLILAPEGETVVLTVRDTGVGIPQDELPRLFERFHRIENTRARTYEGTGIGLALVQELAKLHGGTVRVESNLGHGSTFTVSIPRGAAHLPADRIQGSRPLLSTALSVETYVDEMERWLPNVSAARHTEPLPPRRPSNAAEAADAATAQKHLIVLADDNADMRDYVSRLLQKEYRVHAVSDGLQALEAARQLRPALILTDVMMPGLDGFQMLEAVRRDPVLSNTPVILLSARAGEESRVEGLEAGADDYLVKPFTARELLARVATHIKMSHLRGKAAERLQLAQTAAQMGSWEWDPAQNTSVLSPELHRMFGTDAADPEHANIWASHIEPADRQMLEQRLRTGYEAGAMELEYRYRHPKDGLRWFYCKGRRLPGESRMLGVVLDITARKQIELRSAAQYKVTRALAESPDLPQAAPQILRAVCEVLDWTLGGLWVVDQHTATLRCVEMLLCDPNGNAAKFINASRKHSFTKGQGLPGQVWLKREPVWMPDFTAEANFPRTATAQADGLHAACGFPVLSRGQVLGVLEFFSHEVRQPDDGLLEMMASIGAQIGQYMDRIQAEQEQHKLVAIVESSDDAIVSKDLNGIVTSWNPGAERMFGYRPEEIIGQSITRIIPPELHDDERRILETIARGERIEHFETVRLTKTGERIDVSLTISPIRNQAGKITGASKIARDITQRKRTEHALRTSERLASVGRLAATVAHEINNPLEAVTNLVYLARRAANGVAVDYLARAEEELERISHISKQTLGFYRDPRGAAPTQIGSFITPLMTIFGPRMRNMGIHLRTEIRQDPEIIAVPGEIRQLLANFLSNSIDALGAGGQIFIRLSAITQFAGEPRPGVRLTIADTGHGIPASIRRRLFEPFFTTKKDVGTGLGLWICKSIVEKHGGSIHVRSCDQAGRSWTAFSVFLPLAHETEVSEQHAIRKAV